MMWVILRVPPPLYDYDIADTELVSEKYNNQVLFDR